MVQGLKFLSKKSFNPQNHVNRKQVWEAQQSTKLEQERIQKRQAQLRKERDDEELCEARNRGDGSQAQLRFMYDAPPGMETRKKSQEEEDVKEPSGSSQDVAQVQPGDDAAAAAFRRMLAASRQGQQQEEDKPNEDPHSIEKGSLGFAPVLQGSTLTREEEFQNKIGNDDTRSALEKAVGAKDRGGALTLEEQVARFPQLKHAPMAKGMSATDVNVSFKPLGSQLRNVKCLACGVWGHSRGDRECSQTGWDPFSMKAIPRGAAASSNLRPSEKETTNQKEKLRRYENGEAGREDLPVSSSSSSSSSSDDSRRKRKRKHRSHSRHRKRRYKESSSRKRHRKRKHRRRERSESPSRGRKRSKSRSRDYD